MMKISADRVTNRLQYTLDFIFNRSEDDYTFVEENADFVYSQESNVFKASTILFESNIRELHLASGVFSEEPCLIIDGVLDPIATIFLCISRYEEYHAKFLDQHDRFMPEHSFMAKFGWMDLAVADRLCIKLLESWTAKIKQNQVRIIPTFDIDNTFAFKEKGLRSKLSVFRDIIHGNKTRLTERKEVKKGERDPYDTYEKIEEIAKKFEVKVFWLLADWSNNDRNVHWQNDKQAALINKLSGCTDIGIHPGYKSFLSTHRVKKEIDRLSKIIDRPVVNSRQHFLRGQIPDSYRLLIDVGIKNDYTMGYASVTGFRAGTASIYNWFDIEKDQITDLKVFPFVYMDGTLNEYLKLNPQEAKERILKIYTEVKNYCENFIFLWHNETIGEYGIWKGWGEVLDYTLTIENE